MNTQKDCVFTFKKRSLFILAVLNTLCAVAVILVMTVHYDEQFWAHFDDSDDYSPGKTWVCYTN